MTGDGDGDMEGAQATDAARDTAVTEEDIGPIEDRGKELSRKRGRRSASSSAFRGSAPRSAQQPANSRSSLPLGRQPSLRELRGQARQNQSPHPGNREEITTSRDTA